MSDHQRSKIEILKTIRDFIELSEKVSIPKFVLREPPWDIDPQTAEEFFQVIHFCQHEFPPIQYSTTDQKLLVERASKYQLKIAVLGSNKEIVDILRSGDPYYKKRAVSLDTLGLTIYKKQVKEIKIVIVFFSDLKSFPKLHSNFIGTNGAIVIFDKNDHQSFLAVKEWHSEFKNQIPESDVVFSIIGINNKPQVVTTTETRTLAKELGAAYYEMKENDLRTFDIAMKAIAKKFLDAWGLKTYIKNITRIIDQVDDRPKE
ncbi:MAG: hypothetical protein ACFFDI_02615 [Promethearchaeota archaeon]